MGNFWKKECTLYIQVLKLSKMKLKLLNISSTQGIYESADITLMSNVLAMLLYNFLEIISK